MDRTFIKKAFSGLVVLSALVYIVVVYYILFRLAGREMVVMSEHMLDNYNYGNAVNLLPFKTIIEYVITILREGMWGHAIWNLAGNFLLFFPAGFYLPFFLQATRKIKVYGGIMAGMIIVIEVVQLVTKTGSLDIDDFILNWTGAMIGFIFFSRTPARALLKLRAW